MKTFLMATLLFLNHSYAQETINLSISASLNLTSIIGIRNQLDKLWASSDIIIIGESHEDLYGKKLLSEAIAYMDLSYEKKCFFIEEASYFSEAFEKNSLKEMEFSYFDLFVEQLELFKEVFGYEPAYRIDFGDLFRLKSKGFKLIPVDQTLTKENMVKIRDGLGALSGEKSKENVFFESLYERNTAMSQNIKNAISRGDCLKSIFVVGSGHIATKEESVPLKLKKEGLRTSTVVLSDCYQDDKCETYNYYDLDLRINLL